MTIWNIIGLVANIACAVMLFYQAKTITKLQKENRYLRTEFSFNPYRARGDITLVYDAADQSVNIDIDRILRTAMDMRGFRDS